MLDMLQKVAVRLLYRDLGGERIFLALCTVGNHPCRWSVLLNDFNSSITSSQAIVMLDE